MIFFFTLFIIIIYFSISQFKDGFLPLDVGVILHVFYLLYLMNVDLQQIKLFLPYTYRHDISRYIRAISPSTYPTIPPI